MKSEAEIRESLKLTCDMFEELKNKYEKGELSADVFAVAEAEHHTTLSVLKWVLDE